MKADTSLIGDLVLQLQRELAEKTNEASNWHQHYRDEASKAQKCKQAFIGQEKKVARLRELLDRAIEIAGNFECSGLPKDHFMVFWKVQKHEFSKLKAESRLAPAPEEPTIYFREPTTEESKVLDKVLDQLRKEDRHYKQK